MTLNERNGNAQRIKTFDDARDEIFKLERLKERIKDGIGIVLVNDRGINIEAPGWFLEKMADNVEQAGKSLLMRRIAYLQNVIDAA